GIVLQLEDIVSSWAGLRPLINEEGKSPSELSRKDEIFVSDSGLVSIAGGKLTGYRKMAERTVDLIAKRMEEDSGIEIKACTTDKIPLCGNGFKKYKHVKNYISEVYAQLQQDGFLFYDAWNLVTTYGKQTETILQTYKTLTDKDKYLRLAKAELHFGVDYEMIQNPTDFFVRRTGRLYFDIESVKDLMEPILEEFRSIFKWNDGKVDFYRTELQKLILKCSDFSLKRS